MFSGLKDSLTSSAARSLLASRLDRYAKLTDLRISSREKTISAELVLEGEVRIGGQVRAALGRQPDLGGHARPLLPPSLLHHKAPLAGCQRAPGGSWPQGRLLE